MAINSEQEDCNPLLEEDQQVHNNSSSNFEAFP